MQQAPGGAARGGAAPAAAAGGAGAGIPAADLAALANNPMIGQLRQVSEHSLSFCERRAFEDWSFSLETRALKTRR